MFNMLLSYHILPGLRYLWKMIVKNIVFTIIAFLIFGLFYYQYFSSILTNISRSMISLPTIKAGFCSFLIVHFFNRFLPSKKEATFSLMSSTSINLHFLVIVISKSLKNLGFFLFLTLFTLPYVFINYKGRFPEIVLYVLNDYSLYFSVYLASVYFFINFLKFKSILISGFSLILIGYDSIFAFHTQWGMNFVTFLAFLLVLLLSFWIRKTKKVLLRQYLIKIIVKKKRAFLGLFINVVVTVKVYLFTFIFVLNSSLSLLLTVGTAAYFYYLLFFQKIRLEVATYNIIVLVFPSLLAVAFNTLFMETFNKVNFLFFRTTPSTFMNITYLLLKPHIIILFLFNFIVFLPAILHDFRALLYVIASSVIFSLLSWLFIFNRLNQKNVASFFYFITSLFGIYLSITIPLLSILFFIVLLPLLYRRSSLNFEYMVIEEGLFS